MAQPRAYTQTTNFNDFSTTNPADPHSGANLDTEFTELRQNTDDLNTNIALIQRDDGKLKNEAVHKDAFDQDALVLIGLSGYTLKGAWATATAYVVGDLVTNNDATYVATEDHTSATFSTDIANWILIANSAIETTGASVNTYTGDGIETVFATTYDYSGVTDIQVFVAGSLVTTNLYTVGTNIITFTSPPANTAKVIIWGDAVVSQTAAAATLGYRDTTNNHATTAERWANLTTDSVTDAETSVDSTKYSAKAWAVGGTEVTQTAARGASKEWATTVGGKVDGVSGDYSSKEYAIGTTASTGGSSKDWASKTSAIVDSADYSSKEWAAGQLAANTSGSAKQWSIGGGAFVEGTAVEGSNYSAKKYATDAANSETAVIGVANTVSLVHDDLRDLYLGAGTTNKVSADACTLTGAVWVKGENLITGLTVASGAVTVGQKLTVDGGEDSTGFPTTTEVQILAWSSGTSTITINQIFSASNATTPDLTGAGLGLYAAYTNGPSTDNDGNTLIDGALYYDSTIDSLMVYDLGATTWLQIKPNTSQQANIDTVAGQITPTNNVATVAGKATEIGQLAVLGTAGVDITTVSNIGTNGADVSTVAGITSGDVSKVAIITTGDVSKVAAIATGDVTKVANITTGDVTRVADVDTEIALLGTSAMAHATTGNLVKLGAGYDGTATQSGTNTNLTQVNTVANNITTVNDFANRYRVAANADLPLPNLDAGDLYFNTNTNELNVYNATTSAWQQATPNQGDIDAINIVAGNIIYQEDLGSIATAVTTSTVTNEIGKVAALEDEIERLGTAPMATASTGSIALLGTTDAVADMALLGLAPVIADMAALDGSAADMAVLGASGVVDDMETLSASGVVGNIATVAGSIGNVNRYANEYVISETAPTSPTPTAGDLWYDSTSGQNVVKYYNGSAFAAITTGMSSLATDTSPALGGALDANNYNFTEVGTISGDNLQIDFGTLP